jgi:hypothetical protein
MQRLHKPASWPAAWSGLRGRVREYDDPGIPGETYTTTWFDMFRIADGKIVEHWDPAQKF